MRVVLLSILCTNQLFAQVNKDTLAIYYKRLQAGDIDGAGYIMSAYECNHPTNPQVWHLLANIYFWQKNFMHADDHYKMALMMSPGDNQLRCDYAEFLLDQLRINESYQMIQKVFCADPNNERALLIFGKLLYWKGDFHKSSIMLNAIEGNSPVATQAQLMLEDVKAAKAPHISMQPQWYADNQIMYASINRIKGEMAYSSMFNPECIIQADRFMVNSINIDKYTFQVGNTFLSFATATSLKLTGGLLYNQSTRSATELVYSAVLKQKIFNFLTLDGNFDRKPYNFNKNSVVLPFMQSEFGVNMTYENDPQFQAKMGYLLNRFDDGNNIKNFYAWGIIQLISRPQFKLGGGFGLNWNHSNRSMFVPKLSVAEWIASGASKVNGYYNPYFTPLQQQVFSVLGTVEKKINRSLKLQGAFNYGVIAYAYIPYFYPYVVYPSQIEFSSGEAGMTFHPYDVKLKLIDKTQSGTEWSLGYTYIHNNFYTCHLLEAGIQFILYSAKEISE